MDKSKGAVGCAAAHMPLLCQPRRRLCRSPWTTSPGITVGYKPLGTLTLSSPAGLVMFADRFFPNARKTLRKSVTSKMSCLETIVAAQALF